MTRAFPLLLVITLSCGAARADVIHLTGNLNDSSDPRIVGPGINGAGALFDTLDPSVSANNVVLYSLTLAAPASVHFTAPGADASLIDPYLSIFTGSGNSAMFLASYFGAAFGDPVDITRSLGAGDYMVALTAFLNMSFAENLGTGVLGDGFIGLANFTGGTNYDLTIDKGTAGSPVPEPSSIGLIGVALIGIALSAKRYCEFPNVSKDPTDNRG